MRETPALPAPHDAGGARSRNAVALGLASGVYLAWTATTYVLEGRTLLLTRFDPGARILYALVANVAIGTVVAMLAARKVVTVPWRPRAIAVGLALVGGASLVMLLAPPRARDAVVLLNAFTQVLPTSIAEVVVCWMLLGSAVQRATRSIGPRTSVVLAVLAADVAFAVYHVAHSPPFDQPAMMVFLAIPGLVISVIVLVVRDPYAAVLAQNFFAVIGMSKNLDPAAFRHPFTWAYGLAAFAVVVLGAMSLRERPEQRYEDTSRA